MFIIAGIVLAFFLVTIMRYGWFGVCLALYWSVLIALMFVPVVNILVVMFMAYNLLTSSKEDFEEHKSLFREARSIDRTRDNKSNTKVKSRPKPIRVF